jgi:hypothetical protein
MLVNFTTSLGLGSAIVVAVSRFLRMIQMSSRFIALAIREGAKSSKLKSVQKIRSEVK